MPRLLRPRYADVTATLALVIALGTGGAYAATSLVSTRQIANGAVTTAKIHSNAVTSAKLSAALRSQLSQPTFAPWGKIPSGKTVTGQFYQTGISGGTTAERIENVNFPARTPVALGSSRMGFGNTAFGNTATTNCNGTYSNPSAPRGWLCVYPGSSSGLTAPGLNVFDDPGRDYSGFYLNFNESAANTTWYYYGSWAYTAP